MKTGLLVVSLVIVAIGYSLYVPIPDGIDGAWKVRILAGESKLLDALATLGEKLGLGSKLDNIRYLMNTGMALAVNNSPSLGIVAIDDIIDGVPVRIYYPEKKTPDMAGLIYIHGGGWVAGNVDTFDGFVRNLTVESSTITISIDYRLAPEHPFPAPFDDCVKVTEYVLKNGNEFGIDSSRVAIAGDSAGGQLSAAVSLKLRNFKPNSLKAQLLIYPALQSVDLQTPSYLYNEKHFSGGIILTRQAMAYYYTNHASGNTDDMEAMLEGKHVDKKVWKKAKSTLDYNLLPNDEIMNEYAKPIVKTKEDKMGKKLKDVTMNPYYNTLLAPDVSGVPEAYIVTCQYDVLRDDGIWYVKKLEKAGVKVTHDHMEHGFHGFNIMIGMSADVDQATARMVGFLKTRLA